VKAAQEGRAVPDGIAFSLDLTHQELAAPIGAVREFISRTLIRFQERRIISMKSRTILLLDEEDILLPRYDKGGMRP